MQSCLGRIYLDRTKLSPICNVKAPCRYWSLLLSWRHQWRWTHPCWRFGTCFWFPHLAKLAWLCWLESRGIRLPCFHRPAGRKHLHRESLNFCLRGELSKAIYKLGDTVQLPTKLHQPKSIMVEVFVAAYPPVPCPLWRIPRCHGDNPWGKVAHQLEVVYPHTRDTAHSPECPSPGLPATSWTWLLQLQYGNHI